MTEPLMRVLAKRGERLTIAAMPWVAPIYRAMTPIAEVIELPFPRAGLHWTARRALANLCLPQFIQERFAALVGGHPRAYRLPRRVALWFAESTHS